MAPEGEPMSGRPPRSVAPAYAVIAGRVSSHGALWVAAAWGFAEASFLFVVPDVWLGLVALFAPRRMLATLAAIVAGAAAGAACLYLLTLAFGDAVTSLILALPAIGDADLEQARALLADDGASATFTAVLEGRAVKLYVHAAALDGIGLGDVVAFTVLNRLARLLVFGLVLAAVGWAGRPIVARWPRSIVALYALAWVAFYAGYLASHQA
jgi:hypothetical protein